MQPPENRSEAQQQSDEKEVEKCSCLLLGDPWESAKRALYQMSYIPW